MPNWCENDLTITGPKESVETFIKYVHGEDLFEFSTIIPYPKKYKDLDEAAIKWDEENRNKLNVDWTSRPKDGFNQGGYDWCIENWGTKWGACNVSKSDICIKDNLASVEYTFDTAWSPPIPVINVASCLFPELIFELNYFECGAGFNGTVIYKEGEAITDSYNNKYNGSRGG